MAIDAGSRIPVRWVGDQYALHSLAIVNRQICSRLAAHRLVDLEVVSRERATSSGPAGDGGSEHEVLAGAATAATAARAATAATSAVAGTSGGAGREVAAVEVRHQWPPEWNPPANGRWVLVQPWEFESLPCSWVDAVTTAVDEVWCYTTFVRDCYVSSGVDQDRVAVIPLGVDLETFKPSGMTTPLRTSKKFKFLFVGGLISRKGIDVLLAAYRAAFSSGDDVCLVIKAHGGAGAYAKDNFDEMARLVAADPGWPEVEIVDDGLAPDKLAGLYRACDLLVHPYRAEGFGLPVAEAMSCGLPVAVTSGGACDDFVDASVGFRLPARRSPLSIPDVGPATSTYYWLEPDARALRDLLRWCFANPSLLSARSAAARDRAEALFSWDATADMVVSRLVALSAKPARRSSPRPAAAQVAPMRSLAQPEQAVDRVS